MDLHTAKSMIRTGVPFGDVLPFVAETEHELLRDWFVREPGLPNLAARRVPVSVATGDFCRCGGPLAQTGSCKTCQWGCGYSSGGCG